MFPGLRKPGLRIGALGSLGNALFDALGIPNRGVAWEGYLGEIVQPVVVIPLVEEGQSIDSTFNDAEASNAFNAEGYLASTVTNAQIQLKNPSTSGKIVYLDKVYVDSTTMVHFGMRDTDLATAGSVGQCRNGSGASSSARVRTEYTVAVLDGYAAGEGAGFLTTGQMVRPLEFDPPIRLAAGEGWAVRSDAGSNALRVAFHYREYSAAS